MSTKGYTGESSQNLNFRPWIQSHLHKKCKQKCQILTSNKNVEQTKPRKELTSSMAKSSMCSVGTNLVQGVNLRNLILDYLKTIKLYRGRHSPSTPLQLGPHQNTHLPKSTKSRRIRRTRRRKEDMTNHKGKQGLKQEVTSHTVTRPPMTLWHIGRRRTVL